MPKNHVAWLQMEGKDAQDFLQRLSTVDVGGMAIGETRPGCFLDPQGRIVSFFYLHKKTGTFLFEFENETNGTQLKALMEFIDRFHFSESFALQNLTAPPENETTHLITEASTRIARLIPGVPGEINSQVNPLEVNLRQAIAEQKGCYPGQEVLEKILSIGAPARRLVQIEGVINLGPLHDKNNSPVGNATTVSGNKGLAIVRKTHAQIGLALYQKSDVPIHITEVS